MIDADYFLELVKAYAKTDEGKKVIKKHLSDAYKNGINKGGLTKDKVDVLSGAITAELMQSISKVIPSFRTNSYRIKKRNVDKDGFVNVSVSIDENALRRQSLWYPASDGTRRQGDGVYDIVGLFVHGYDIEGMRPWGWWEHSNGGNRDWVGARKHRDGNPFLEEYVKSMNEKYKDVCVVELDDFYKDDE